MAAELIRDAAFAVRRMFSPKYGPILEYDEDDMLHLEKQMSRWPKASKIFWSLVPSFISRPLGHCDVDICEPDATSYLNGLRGIASLIVVLQHNTNEYFPANHRGYGDQPGDNYISQLPFIRLILSGSFMVAIFFVISGFALSYSPLKRMHAAGNNTMLESLPSSVFRRPIRLFLPIFPVLIISSIMIRMNIFYQLGSEAAIPPQPTLVAEMLLACREFLTITVKNVGSRTMPQVWTIAAEYWGSLLVFLCCLSFQRVATWVRMSFVLALFIYHMYHAMWELALFLVGMLLADIRHIRAKMLELTGRKKQCMTCLTWLVFAFSLYSGGWPIYGNGANSMGMSYIAWIPTGNVPRERFWHAVSGILLVSSLENLPVLQRALNWKPILYLGEISYAMYLVHWMVAMNVLTKGTILRLRVGQSSHIPAWLAGMALSLPLCLWVADIHWRLVDRKSVKLAKWMSDKIGV